ncbi:MAG TPA: S26 family signal peptidase, partial [Candidatus Sulfotelmatobacter sp.]|nr:S26 family signal peptidase [Candidatus Sulfotelmatobacter sp.]
MPEITSKEPGDRQLPPIERLDPPDPRAAVRLRPALGVWLRDLIVSLAISAFIIVFIYQPVKVEGTSMMPSLQDQERIFVNKFVYRLEP